MIKFLHMPTRPALQKKIDSKIYEDARSSIAKAMEAVQSLRGSLEKSMDAPGGMTWEQNMGAPPQRDPTPSPLTAVPAAPPQSQMEAARRTLFAEQIERNWPSLPKPFKRKRWRWLPK